MAGLHGGRARCGALRRVRLYSAVPLRSHLHMQMYPPQPRAVDTRRSAQTAKGHCPVSLSSLSINLSTVPQRPTEVLWSNWPELGS